MLRIANSHGFNIFASYCASLLSAKRERERERERERGGREEEERERGRERGRERERERERESDGPAWRATEHRIERMTECLLQ